jgi:hypothetical protein
MSISNESECNQSGSELKLVEKRGVVRTTAGIMSCCDKFSGGFAHCFSGLSPHRVELFDFIIDIVLLFGRPD